MRFGRLIHNHSCRQGILTAIKAPPGPSQTSPVVTYLFFPGIPGSSASLTAVISSFTTLALYPIVVTGFLLIFIALADTKTSPGRTCHH